MNIINNKMMIINTKRGMTLLEVIIYSTLISMLLVGIISFDYGILFGDLDTSSKVDKAYGE
jgi:Tfp pilus assembly protein PilV